MKRTKKGKNPDKETVLPEMVETPLPETVEVPVPEVVEIPLPETVEGPEVVEIPLPETVEEPVPEMVEIPTVKVPLPEVIEIPLPETVENKRIGKGEKVSETITQEPSTPKRKRSKGPKETSSQPNQEGLEKSQNLETELMSISRIKNISSIPLINDKLKYDTFLLIDKINQSKKCNTHETWFLLSLLCGKGMASKNTKSSLTVNTFISEGGKTRLITLSKGEVLSIFEKIFKNKNIRRWAEHWAIPISTKLTANAEGGDLWKKMFSYLQGKEDFNPMTDEERGYCNSFCQKSEVLNKPGLKRVKEFLHWDLNNRKTKTKNSTTNTTNTPSTTEEVPKEKNGVEDQNL